MTPEERAMRAVLKLFGNWEDNPDTRNLMTRINPRPLAHLEKIIREAVAEEREECAKIAEEYIEICDRGRDEDARSIVQRIRARGKEQGK